MVKKIISGGQTGADRAGLDYAINNWLDHGGWCPKNRRAEDGAIDPRYQLQETEDDDYNERTELNVKGSDATVIFTKAKLGAGSNLTKRLAEGHGKPWLIVKIQNPKTAANLLRRFLERHSPEVLNVAGTRESHCPEIYKFTYNVLGRAL